jgi:hypothetical protein
MPKRASAENCKNKPPLPALEEEVGPAKLPLPVYANPYTPLPPVKAVKKVENVTSLNTRPAELLTSIAVARLAVVVEPE